MKDTFLKIVDPIMDFEAGFDPNGGDHTDPNDPGRRTRWGLAKASNPDLDFDNLSRAEAGAVYLNRYWRPYPWLEDLPFPIDAIAFDDVVNEGPGVAAEVLQKAVGINPPTGFVGPVTIGRAKALAAGHPDVHLLSHYCAVRGHHYENLAQARGYGEGWLFRLFYIHEVVLRLGGTGL